MEGKIHLKETWREIKSITMVQLHIKIGFSKML